MEQIDLSKYSLVLSEANLHNVSGCVKPEWHAILVAIADVRFGGF